MRVRLVDPNAVIRDPHTKQALPVEGGDVPETNFWIRRLLAGEVVRVIEPVRPVVQPKQAAPDEPETPKPAPEPTFARLEPTGIEPVAPLTTREE